ncbi:MAG: putative glycoside hydrolase [Acetobacteraceae bacterium]|nr:putative glycoside hydrolase [Acetobacteraceae bacterium]
MSPRRLPKVARAALVLGAALSSVALALGLAGVAAAGEVAGAPDRWGGVSPSPRLRAPDPSPEWSGPSGRAFRLAREPVKPQAVRGLYMTGWTAGRPAEFLRLLALIDGTELNAAVVDVKDVTGRTTYPTRVPAAVAAGASSSLIPDLRALVRELERRHIYPIARLVVFCDPVLARARPELAVSRAGGGIWRDRTGAGWTNPYLPQVWEYNLALAAEAVEAGFREIQFDYVRFPSDGFIQGCVYPGADGRPRSRVVAAFLSLARERLGRLGAVVSADIFGLVPSAEDDLGIGQYLEHLAPAVDILCPMAYPSHYAPGSFGLPDPDLEPRATVSRTLSDALHRLKRWDPAPVLRPWLQDFSLRNPYGPSQVRAEIQAVLDAGLESYLLWNPSNRYTAGALRPASRDWGVPLPLP